MSVEYISTRGEKEPCQFTDTLLRSTASDGGLYVPERFPRFSLEDLQSLTSFTYSERAAIIISRFQPNLDKAAILEDTRSAYGKNFDHPDIAPVVGLNSQQHMLELHHGPTSAFKDMALQLMPRLFSRSVEQVNLRRDGEGRAPLHYLILVATSGDTGKAALEGYRDIPGCSLIAYFPDNGVSGIQKLSMTTQEGGNVSVHPMRGNFDQIQKRLKEMFDDKKVERELKDRNVVLSSANSINWGRIAPQVVYHVNTYVEMMKQGAVRPGDMIDIAVPTGNFGNALAAFYAKQMGLPVDKLICATNENNVVTQFLQTGVYDLRNREIVPTHSPSMNILIANNIERLLFAITGDPQKVSRWMQEREASNYFEVDRVTADRLKDEFYTGSVNNDKCLTNIRRTVDKTGYLMDTHSSVAQAVAEEYLEATGSTKPVVVACTAHWAKFAPDVRRALTGQPGLPKEGGDHTVSPEDEFGAIDEVKRMVPGSSVPRNITDLEGKPEIHKTVFDATLAGVKESLNAYLERKK